MTTGMRVHKNTDLMVSLYGGDDSSPTQAHTDRHTHKHTHIHTHTHNDREREGKRGREEEREKERKRGRLRERKTQTNTYTHKQIHTYTHAHIHTYTYGTDTRGGIGIWGQRLRPSNMPRASDPTPTSEHHATIAMTTGIDLR